MKVIEIDQGRLIGEDIRLELEAMLDEKYQLYLKDRKFKISAIKDGGEVRVTVTLEDNDQDFHYPVESRLDLDTEDLRPTEAALFLVDYIELYFQDFFDQEEDLYIPIDWADYEYDAVSFQLRGQVRNLRLERMADEWLENNPTPSP